MQTNLSGMRFFFTYMADLGSFVNMLLYEECLF